MPNALETLRLQMRELHDRMEEELAEKRAEFRYRIENGRAVFDEEMRRRHRELKVRLTTFLAGARPMVIVTAPVIYALIVPFALLDLFVTAYQAICFPVYGIAKVRRADHIVFDRQLLGYLNAIQKLNCVYCGYCNGLLSYVREIAGRTEQYWCPIKHARRVAGAHDHYPDFLDYGDAEGFRCDLDRLRGDLRAANGPGGCKDCSCGEDRGPE